MPNENDHVEVENNEEALDLELEVDPEEPKPAEGEKPKEKKVFTPEEQLAIHERNAKKLRKQLGLDTEQPKESKEKAPSNDLGEKAYLIANGIKEADEIALAKKLSKETGKDIESLLGTTYFQTELKEMREAKATDNARPSGNKRASNSAIDTVEYWIAKGELPPASEKELRQQVVNARLKKEEAKGPFYNS